MRTSLMQVLSTSVQGLTQKSFSTSFSRYPRWNCSQISTHSDECKSHLIKWRLNWFEWILFWVTCRRRFWERCRRSWRLYCFLIFVKFILGELPTTTTFLRAMSPKRRAASPLDLRWANLGMRSPLQLDLWKNKNVLHVGIWNQAIQNLETFENWTFWRLDFKW